MKCFTFRVGQSVTDGERLGIVVRLQTFLHCCKAGVVWPGEKRITYHDEVTLRRV